MRHFVIHVYKTVTGDIYITYIYIYIYVYIHMCVCVRINIYIIPSSINRTTMNLLLKVSRFFQDLQVNVLLTKIFLDFLC